MSTLKVSEIQHPSAATAAITLDADGGALIGGQAAYARNLLYNGAMQVAQRGTSTASITAGGYYTADRWNLILGTMGTWTQSVDADGPSGSGLTKSIKMLCTTADASPAAGDFNYVTQILEGQDIQRIAKGSASAQQVTLSFWVKSNATGTYIARLYDEDNNRSVSASYSVSASATWERKTITFPADATGAFANDNGSSLYVQFWLGAGSNRTSGTLQTTWGTVSDANAAVGQTNLAAATNNYWQVTGVQLEVGPAATPFEFKSFGQELRECQRYYYRMQGSNFTRFAVGHCTGTANGNAIMQFPVSMRANPSSMDTSGTASHYAIFHGSTVTPCSSVPTLTADKTLNTAAVDGAVAGGGLPAGAACQIIANNTTAAFLGFSAEL
jgi:hypothetical protein